jgi:hypothetical protein
VSTRIDKTENTAEIAAAILLTVRDRGKLEQIVQLLGAHLAQKPQRQNPYAKLFDDDRGRR